MIKTGKEVQGDIMSLLYGSSLASMLTGDVYFNGYRPRDSQLEDAIVIFTTATSDQIQEGIVTINIYVPDIDAYSNGVLIENGSRTKEIEIALNTWVDELPKNTDYFFYLDQAITTVDNTDINQHFVVARLGFKILTY